MAGNRYKLEILTSDNTETVNLLRNYNGSYGVYASGEMFNGYKFWDIPTTSAGCDVLDSRGLVIRKRAVTVQPCYASATQCVRGLTPGTYVISVLMLTGWGDSSPRYLTIEIWDEEHGEWYLYERNLLGVSVTTSFRIVLGEKHTGIKVMVHEGSLNANAGTYFVFKAQLERGERSTDFVPHVLDERGYTGVHVLDTSSDIPVVLQANTLGTLSDRRASYSQSVKLPKTPNNCRAFEHLQNYTSGSNIPYKRLPCRLYVDGVQVLGEGYVLAVKGVTPDYFECQIISELPDTIALLEQTSLSDLYMGSVSLHPDTFAVNAIAAPYLCEYATLLSTSVPKAESSSDNYPDDRLDTVVPTYCHSTGVSYTRLLRLVRRVLNLRGLTLQTNVTTIPGYEEDWIPLDRRNTYDKNPYEVQYTQCVGEAMSAGNFTQAALPSMQAGGVEVIQPAYGFIFGSRILTGDNIACVRYLAIYDMYVSVEFDYVVSGQSARVKHVSSVFHEKIARYGDVPDRSILYEDDVEMINGSTRSFSEYIELKQGESLIFLNRIESHEHTGLYSSTMKVTDTIVSTEGALIPTLRPGVHYPIHRNLPLANGKELLQLFVNLYGLNMEIDHRTNTLRAYSFKALTDNIAAGNYKDWTDMLAMPEKSRTFSFSNYGKVNKVSFEDNEDRGVKSEAIYRIDAPGLPYNGQNLELPLLSLPDLDSPLYGVRYRRTTVPCQEAREDGQFCYVVANNSVLEPFDAVLRKETLYSWKETPLCVVQYSPSVVARDICVSHLNHPYGTSINFLPDSEGVAISRGAQYYADTYHTYLTRLVKNAQVVQIGVMLDAYTVSRIDFRVPVYLASHGAFFYISKINNYVPGSVTTVELVKINLYE